MSPETQWRMTVKRCFFLLEKEKAYQQTDIVDKLKSLGFVISESTFSNLVNDKSVGNKMLKSAAIGMIEITKSELGAEYSAINDRFSRLDNWEATIIPIADIKKPGNRQGIVFHNHGRLPIAAKLELMKSAKQQIVEFGLRLNTFIGYFYHRSKFEFKRPLIQLLADGIDLTLYFIDATAPEASIYFNDQARIIAEESESLAIIQRNEIRLRQIRAEISELDLPGKLRVFTYRHIPHSHFLIIDGSKAFGKMVVSNYLYGIKRADCPAVEIIKQEERELFKIYYKSFVSLSADAKELIG